MCEDSGGRVDYYYLARRRFYDAEAIRIDSRAKT